MTTRANRWQTRRSATFPGQTPRSQTPPVRTCNQQVRGSNPRASSTQSPRTPRVCGGPETHRAILDPATRGVELDVAVDRPNVGVWESGYWRSVEYVIDGASIAVRTTMDAGFDPYAQFAALVDSLTVTDVDSALAVVDTRGRQLPRVRETAGVMISIEGSPTIDEAVRIGESIG